VSAPVPARTWRSSSRAARYTLNVEQTDGGASGVQLSIGAVTVLLDRAQTGQLVTDLLRRLALIGGRYAAVRAAADSSIDHQRGPRLTDHAWTVTGSGRDPDVVDAVIYCGERHPTLDHLLCGLESRHDGLCRGIDPRTGVVHDWHAADPSITEQRGPQPDRVWTVTGWPTDRVWSVTDDGRDALRGRENAETDPPGALTPPDPRSPGSADGGGAR